MIGILIITPFYPSKTFFNKITSQVNKLIKDKKDAYLSKFRQSYNKFSKFKFIIFSDIWFNENEMALLSLGLKQSLHRHYTERDFLDLSVDLDSIIEYLLLVVNKNTIRKNIFL